MKPSGVDSLIPAPQSSSAETVETSPHSAKKGGSKNVNFSIEEDLHRRLKMLSVASGIPLKDLFMDALRMYLREKENKEK